MRSSPKLTAHRSGQEGHTENACERRFGRRGQLDEMLERLNALVAEGLAHGFFEYTMKCEIGANGRRQVLIQAGKSHKFNIPENEIPP
jgi:hypothetical protein